MNSTPPLICIVDDESGIRETLEGILNDEGYLTRSFPNASSFLEALSELNPSLVLLDIWLPGMDGLAVLTQLRGRHPDLPVVMMSGHAGIESAVNAIKLGASDFLEKPLHLEVLLDKVSGLAHGLPRQDRNLPSDTRLEIAKYDTDLPPGSAEIVESGRRQRTLKSNVVLNGTGLLSGRNTGLILSPLDANSGVVFQALDGTSIPGHITSLEGFAQSTASQTFTANSTVLTHGSRRIRTVEHLMASLFMAGLTNVLVKADEEVPNVDGSAIDFTRLIEEVGVEEQDAPRREVVVHKRIQVGTESPNEKHLFVEPYDGFEVHMRVDYPAPILEQQLVFNENQQDFAEEIAPARSFNTFENIDMAQKLGKVGSGYLNSHIILHEGKVINTELRYPDEFVRHKILDLIGDLYLIGFPVRGRFTANMTSHGYNQALVQKIHHALS
ncbi:MAG: UDP-3-O-acyl-N-acetylglucosamine deacetylase [bacterium]|jgi:UDP-3-O-[3-hydroxymyristoyl] N-acetylglucosamine deacetylase